MPLYGPSPPIIPKIVININNLLVTGLKMRCILSELTKEAASELLLRGISGDESICKKCVEQLSFEIRICRYRIRAT